MQQPQINNMFLQNQALLKNFQNQKIDTVIQSKLLQQPILNNQLASNLSNLNMLQKTTLPVGQNQLINQITPNFTQISSPSLQAFSNQSASLTQNVFNQGLHHKQAPKRKNATKENTAPLKNWLTRHHANPYPTKQDKMVLTHVSGMSMTQISTWFANARRRMKKELNLFPYQKLASESISSDSGRDSVKFGDNSPNELNSTSNLSFSAASSTSGNSAPNSPKAVGISSYEVNKLTETVIQNLSIPVDWQTQISVQVENDYVDVVSPMKESPFARQSSIFNALQSPQTTVVQQTHILVEKPKTKIWSISDML